MKNQQLIFVLSLILLLIVFLFRVNKDNGLEKALEGESVDSVAIRYSANCAGCHGEKLNGFVDRDWKHGKSKEEIVNSITTGYLDAGMPSFAALFSKEQMEELAEFILDGVSKAGRYEFDSVTSPIFSSSLQTVKLDTVLSDYKNPWGTAFLPNGSILITDRSGILVEILSDGSKREIVGVPTVVAEGQGGLLDIELDPGFLSNGFLYLSYSKPVQQDTLTLATTAVAKAKFTDGVLTSVTDIFEAFPPHPTRHHYGSRMEFGKDGYLYITVGDRGKRDENPQDLTKDPGKIHRINTDGTVPQDNPFVLNPEARHTIYSYGHRNPQGLTFHPETGQLWETEHGPRGGDELNLIQPGLNYGWPVISYGINYDGTVFTTLTEKEGMEQPVNYWVPSIAPSGLTFVTGDQYPAWKGNLLAGSLRFKYLNRIVLEEGKVIEEEILLKNIGRVRNVSVGPDGYIYVCVEEPGFVFRLIPTETSESKSAE